jgi:hypothetical protein
MAAHDFMGVLLEPFKASCWSLSRLLSGCDQIPGPVARLRPLNLGLEHQVEGRLPGALFRVMLGDQSLEAPHIDQYVDVGGPLSVPTGEIGLQPVASLAVGDDGGTVCIVVFAAGSSLPNLDAGIGDGRAIRRGPDRPAQQVSAADAAAHGSVGPVKRTDLVPGGRRTARRLRDLSHERQSSNTDQNQETAHPLQSLPQAVHTTPFIAASLVTRAQLAKVRKLDHSIGEDLKSLYDNRCQICGENFGKPYETADRGGASHHPIRALNE